MPLGSLCNMKQYLFLQFKRVFRYLPYVLGVSILLFFATAAALEGLLSANEQKLEYRKVNIGVTGSIEDPLLQLGLTAMKTFDDSKFSIELLPYEEHEAKEALAKGEISAYVVMPEDFVNKALYGQVERIRFVTTTETTDIITLFKNEVLKLVTQMVVDAQKGTYGIGEALSHNGYGELANKHINLISWEYVDLALNRGDGVELQELGVEYALSTTEYYLCSLLIFFLLLMGLPFASLYCRRDPSMSVFLNSKGFSNLTQLSSEYLALLLGLGTLVAVIFAGLVLGIRAFDLGKAIEGFIVLDGSFLLALLPGLLLITAFDCMIFELSGNVISGLLTQFFLSLSLCYLSGCFYPLYAFPETVQKVAAVLPVCILREQMAGVLKGKGMMQGILPILLYSGVFFAVALLGKNRKQLRYGGGHR